MKRGRGSDTEDLEDVEVARIVHRTAQAVLVQTDDGEEVWLPLSKVEIDESGPHPVVSMPEWLAIDKGLV
jgi:hypothetical protein